MDERVRRQWAATEAQAYGWGGVSAVSSATGMSRKTIRKGLAELGIRELDPEAPVEQRLRRPGGGRKQLTEIDPELFANLERLIDPTTRGDPMSPLRWTCKSTHELAQALTQTRACAEPAYDRTTAQRGRLQSARQPQDEGRRGPSGSQCAVRAYQCDRQTIPTALTASHLGEHEEEGIGRRVQEWRARVAAQGTTTHRENARLHGPRVRELHALTGSSQNLNTLF